MSDGYRVRCDLLNIEGDTQANAASSTALTKTAYEDIEAIATSEGIYLGTPSVGGRATRLLGRTGARARGQRSPQDKTNKHRGRNGSSARPSTSRATETDASIPSGRAGTDECADAD